VTSEQFYVFFFVLVPCVLHIRVAVGFVGTSRWFRLECDGLRYTSFKDMVSSVVGQGGVGWLCLRGKSRFFFQSLCQRRSTCSSACPNIGGPLKLAGLVGHFGPGPVKFGT
jgi:hypothetical protein